MSDRLVEEGVFTPKQHEVLKRATDRDWYMLLSYGGVRAGKTFINNILFLMELQRARAQADEDGVAEPMYILGAYSSGTLQTNVLQEITNEFGVEFKFDRHNNFTLFGVKVITTFTSSISGLGAIRGMTSYGAYINEASLANREVFNEILNRCSAEGARIIADTNPDYPSHWLKVDYIDKADGEIIVPFHFTLFDNSFLSERYKENLLATTPSGTMTDRDIYGLWTIGEGAVYSDFDRNTMILDPEEIPTDLRYTVGVDWGYEHYGTMVVLGEDPKGTYYLVEEHAYKHKHIDEWLDIAKGIANRYGERINFWCDSARPEYVNALYMAGLRANNANKDRLAGVAEVAKKIKSKAFYVTSGAKKFLDEVDQYVWSPRGDEPIKEHDDVLDAVRYAIYSERRSRQSVIL